MMSYIETSGNKIWYWLNLATLLRIVSTLTKFDNQNCTRRKYNVRGESPPPRVFEAERIPRQIELKNSNEINNLILIN